MVQVVLVVLGLLLVLEDRSHRVVLVLLRILGLHLHRVRQFLHLILLVRLVLVVLEVPVCEIA